MTLTQPTYSAVVPPYWGETWIVASGPSTKDFDFGRLAGKHILAVNDAVKRFSFQPSVALFSLDVTWIQRHRDFLGTLKCSKYLAIPECYWGRCGGIDGAVYLQHGEPEGLSEDPRVINTGCHSGYGALNLAYHKRAWNIHLVGFDLNPEKGSQAKYWLRYYDTALPQLKKQRVFVWNHNKNSSITAFPRVN